VPHDSLAERGAAGPASAPGLCLGPARAHVGPQTQDTQIKAAHPESSQVLRVMPSSSLSIVQLAATASRALPAVASHAIGYADPRPGVHSRGFGAYEEMAQSRLSGWLRM